MNWKLADAKNRFSEVVNLAISEGPQRITRRNDTVIVLREEDYEKFIGKQEDFKSYLINGPHFENIDLQRDTSSIREVDF
ncbi:hypothetical protein MNBD_UNCLBAC01-1274 [hydrothermal vent metagenome]|uniref:Antitoxin n=1 Tax=hydrothermal vent metagenome TaxID=652676 RepID=A0A3B1D7T6_9ZZZZ